MESRQTSAPTYTLPLTHLAPAPSHCRAGSQLPSETADIAHPAALRKLHQEQAAAALPGDCGSSRTAFVL